jgi:hypothetical protein
VKKRKRRHWKGAVLVDTMTSCIAAGQLEEQRGAAGPCFVTEGNIVLSLSKVLILRRKLSQRALGNMPIRIFSKQRYGSHLPIRLADLLFDQKSRNSTAPFGRRFQRCDTGFHSADMPPTFLL